MTSNWKECKLGNVIKTANTGADAITRAPIVEEDTGIKCLRIGDVSQKREYSKWGYTKITDTDFYRYKLEKNDIIIARTGNTIGVNCFIDKDIKAVYNNGLIRIKTDNDKIMPKFMYYIVSSDECQNYVQSIAYGTSTQPNMKIQEFLNFEIVLPPLETQQKIAKVLSAIDDKIELNNSINNNLEQQAQTIFNNKFVNNKPIPSDWKSNNLSGIANYLNGLAMQKFRPNGDEVEIPVLKIKELRQGFCDNQSDLCSPNIKSEYLINNGDVIFSWSGTLCIDVWGSGLCGLNQHLFKITSFKYDKWFYYFWTKYHLNKFIAIASDKATTMGHIKREDLDKSEVLIPDDKTYKQLTSILSPMLELIIKNKIENRQLIKLRNTLLPKLMSGEIDVSNVDIIADKLSFKEEC